MNPEGTNTEEEKSFHKGKVKMYASILAVSLVLTAFAIILLNRFDNSISQAVDCILYDNYDLQINESTVELTAHDEEKLREKLGEYAVIRLDETTKIVCCEYGLATRTVHKTAVSFGILMCVVMLTGVCKEIFTEKTLQ